MKFLYSILLIVLIQACGAENSEVLNTDSDSIPEVIVIDTIPPFESIPSNLETTDLLLPEGFTYTVLFQETNDLVVRADGKKFPAKGSHDMSVFIPDATSPETKGQLYISHETKYADANLGDGGGATIFDIELIDGHWKVVGDFKHVDFSTVGGTNRNCGGSLSPNGTVLTCEEVWAPNTSYLWSGGKGHTDTSFQNGRPLWQNMGYVVEVDPKTKKAVRKFWQMGRMVHEDVHCTPDGKTVYLTDDNSPGIFFKYETKLLFIIEKHIFFKPRISTFAKLFNGQSIKKLIAKNNQIIFFFKVFKIINPVNIFFIFKCIFLNFF